MDIRVRPGALVPNRKALRVGQEHSTYFQSALDGAAGTRATSNFCPPQKPLHLPRPLRTLPRLMNANPPEIRDGCPSCGSREWRPLTTLRGSFTLQRCAGCHMLRSVGTPRTGTGEDEFARVDLDSYFKSMVPVRRESITSKAMLPVYTAGLAACASVAHISGRHNICLAVARLKS